ncbi:MAG: hypothetical protein Q9167_002650 [Letrouitia subvulpina]
MDLAKTLIRSVARAFYETRHVLVIDALMIHSALPNEDLAILLGMQQKDLRKLCAKLREDRLLAVHSRQETREGLVRPINKDYYFIDFHATIDAIKYRVYHLTKRIQDAYKPSAEKKDYYCPRCTAQWTQLEVLDHVGSMGFLCHRCDAPLEREEPSADASSGNENLVKLMSQLDPILKLLQQIDSAIIPKNDFETALSLQVPVQRDEAVNPIRHTVPVTEQISRPAAVKGIIQTTLQPLEIDLTTSGEKTAAEKAAEAQQRAETAAQNQLPIWHTKSTVTGDPVNGNPTASNEIINGAVSSALLRAEEEEEDKKGGVVLNDELEAYYKQMAKEKEKEAREDREAEDSSGEGEDDEDDFEDVGIGGNGSMTPDTPSSSQSVVGDINGTINKKAMVSGALQSFASDSGSSGQATGISTPASEGVAIDQDGRELKRVKIEAKANGVPIVLDEDDEAEFEDAL